MSVPAEQAPVTVQESPVAVPVSESRARQEIRAGADWQDYGNCYGVDPNLFFPERGASQREAKEVCRGCEVKADCLEFALENKEKFGIWGGLSERERNRLRRARSAAALSIIKS